MSMRNVRLITAVVVTAAMTLTMRPPRLLAAPYQLSCVLAGSADAPPAQDGPIAVTFDDDAKTLQAQNGNRNYVFSHVSISNVAISGSVDATSIGIDRSSMGLVWQQYAADKVATEYGQCRSSSSPSAIH